MISQIKQTIVNKIAANKRQPSPILIHFQGVFTSRTCHIITLLGIGVPEENLQMLFILIQYAMYTVHYT